ncbi:MAG: trigger factor [Bacteroidales bacterium]
MNISKEETGTLAACIRIEIAAEDYQEKLNKKLKEYQRKANIPGFRPGMAPVAMIKKMYYKGLLVDEIDNLLRDALENYLKENNLKTLGTPLANDEKSPEADWDNPSDFVFHFDIGIQPEFDVDLNTDLSVDYYKIIPSEEELDKEIDSIRRSYGTFSEVEVSEEGDWMTVDMTELDENGAPVDGGITHSRRITSTTFADDSMKPKLISLKIGDTVVFNPAAVMGGDNARLGYLLGISKEKAEAVTRDFSMTVTKIERIDLPEMNPEFFEKIFPAENVQDVTEFKKKLTEDISRSYGRESDTTFFRAVRKKLMENQTFSLPEEFLKRWVKEREDHHDHDHDHDHVHDHDHEHPEPDYVKVFESMRWQLIENQIIEKFNIVVSPQDVKDYVRARYLNYFAQQGALSGEPEQIEKALDSLTAKYMEQKKDVEEVYDILYFDRLIKVFKSNLTLAEKEVTHDDFHAIDEEHHQHHLHH